MNKDKIINKIEKLLFCMAIIYLALNIIILLTK